MPKLKTRKAAAKRIKLTRKGLLLRAHAFGTHFLEKKSASRKRVIGTKSSVRGANGKNIKRALGV